MLTGRLVGRRVEQLDEQLGERALGYLREHAQVVVRHRLHHLDHEVLLECLVGGRRRRLAAVRLMT